VQRRQPIAQRGVVRPTTCAVVLAVVSVMLIGPGTCGRSTSGPAPSVTTPQPRAMSR
jgi:hypothetical protein